jgi:hypothetical protein
MIKAPSLEEAITVPLKLQCFGSLSKLVYCASFLIKISQRAMAPKAKSKQNKSIYDNTSAASFRRFGKNVLRHTPDARGNSLWILKKGPQKERGLLSAKHIASSRTSANSEALCKLHNFISEEAASVHVSNSYLGDVNWGKDFMAYLRDKGADYLESCKFLNKHHADEKKKDDAEDHVKKYMKFLTDMNEDKVQALQQMVQDSSRLYILGTSMLEQHALITCPDAWNGNVDTKHQKGDYKDFVKKGSASKLEAWIVSLAQKNVKEHEPYKKSLAVRDDASDGEVSDSDKSKDSSGSSSSSSDKKKKKEKKDKKKTKKEKKDNHKEKKDKDKKKKKKKSSSGSSSNSSSKATEEKKD